MRFSMCAGAVVFAVITGFGQQAIAQHATAFDIEDGDRVFQSLCANCHGPDGNLIAGIDLGRGLFRRDYSDAELIGIIRNGIPNTPMPPNPSMSDAQAAQVVQYLRATAARGGRTVRGDAVRGQALFDGKGNCVDCHRVGSRGARTGPDLSDIALKRKADELEQSLRAPAAEIQAGNRQVRLVTRRSETLLGRLLNHDTFTVQILDADERLRSVPKQDLREFTFAQTTMPDATDVLNDDEINDVISYLLTLKGSVAP
ncbi:MAG: c-type cytochrome [Gammaproteobacteria bacterium]|nr:c-type cytochrome [Gammaproteobacteria bacterium]